VLDRFFAMTLDESTSGTSVHVDERRQACQITSVQMEQIKDTKNNRGCTGIL
jgi:hypothetical protein